MKVPVAPEIVILRNQRIEPAELRRLVDLFFEDMVKCVVDVERGVVAVGGEMDPGRGREACIEDTALINIRPAQGNRSMEIQDPAVRERVRQLTSALIGEGEPLP